MKDDKDMKANKKIKANIERFKYETTQELGISYRREIEKKGKTKKDKDILDCQ
jgi:hypothetical protein